MRLPLDVEKDVVAVAASSNGIYVGAKNAQSIGLVSFYDSVDFQKSSEVEAKPRAAENWRLPLRSSEWLLEDESEQENIKRSGFALIPIDGQAARSQNVTFPDRL